MADLSMISTTQRIAFYRQEIRRRTPSRGRHALLMVKIYRNLLASALENQQMEEHYHYTGSPMHNG